ncbi:calcium-binding protein [Anabaena sp. PCC 7108]|uniref:calcium-binding protein n=1 Tax=Anabaena sp. PCC 7108 TaxID=163908 RepID=UPI00034BEDDD|nr:calcium-binding protein [Anabaena sp. PCC 7108]
MALLLGSNINDILNGTVGNDIIFGFDGDDIIDGGDGDDILIAGNGNDTINGGSGDDIIDGGDGNDILDGGDGNDTLDAGSGDDLFKGSAGNDTFNGGSGSDIADYSQLNTSISLKPTGFLDKGIFGTDQLIKIEKIIANSSVTNNTIDSSTAVGASITVNLQSKFLGVNGVPGVGPFTVVNFDDVKGTNLNDSITGDSQNNLLFGNDGDDIFGVSAGNDTIDGGVGNDTADYSQLSTSISLKPTGVLSKGIFGTDQLVKIEKIIANSSVTNNTIDSSTAVGASITVNLQTQSLVVNGVPGVGPFTVVNFDDVNGTNLNDSITGDSQNNLLFGNNGDDILNSGAGKDTLIGGQGVDRFDYRNLANSFLSSFDVITDFDATTGNDLFLVSTARTSFFDAGTVATLSSLDIASVLTAANFVANSAAQFTLDYAFGSRTFVAINNSTAGFSANTDAIIEVTGLTGDLGLNNFTTALV